MYETTLSALKDEGNERMWFNSYVKLAKVSEGLIPMKNEREGLRLSLPVPSPAFGGCVGGGSLQRRG